MMKKNHNLINLKEDKVPLELYLLFVGFINKTFIL